MSIKTKRRLRKTIMIVVLVMIAAIYIYPVYLMFMNSFKPFGEIVADVLAFPESISREIRFRVSGNWQQMLA